MNHTEVLTNQQCGYIDEKNNPFHEGREATTIEVKTANQGSAKNKNRKASGLFVWLLID